LRRLRLSSSRDGDEGSYFSLPTPSPIPQWCLLHDEERPALGTMGARSGGEDDRRLTASGGSGNRDCHPRGRGMRRRSA
jgi:hypothetical protein